LEDVTKLYKINIPMMLKTEDHSVSSFFHFENFLDKVTLIPLVLQLGAKAD
jgi:hypothetical protein